MTVHNFELVNGDTDSIAFKKKDGTHFSDEERKNLLKELNSHMDALIRWEDDDYYRRFIVVKAKNYILQTQEGSVKIKGGSLKATNKEPALRRFINEVIECLLTDSKEHIILKYIAYAKLTLDLRDISDWTFKATVTQSVIKPKPTAHFSKKINRAIAHRTFQEGDKIYLFFRSDGELGLLDEWSGDYDPERLLQKLYDTLCVFVPLVDETIFPNFALKKNREML